MKKRDEKKHERIQNIHTKYIARNNTDAGTFLYKSENETKLKL